nr:MAG TPA: hypothetical protein [Caudoviricetes sp.]
MALYDNFIYPLFILVTIQPGLIKYSGLFVVQLIILLELVNN